MTQNRRYSRHAIDPSIDEVLVRPTPIGLSPEEIAAHRDPSSNPLNRSRFERRGRR
jgi:hypothetical protein